MLRIKLKISSSKDVKHSGDKHIQGILSLSFHITNCTNDMLYDDDEDDDDYEDSDY